MARHLVALLLGQSSDLTFLPPVKAILKVLVTCCANHNLPFLGSQFLLIANGQSIQTVLKVSNVGGALDLFLDFWT